MAHDSNPPHDPIDPLLPPSPSVSDTHGDDAEPSRTETWRDRAPSRRAFLGIVGAGVGSAIAVPQIVDAQVDDGGGGDGGGGRGRPERGDRPPRRGGRGDGPGDGAPDGGGNGPQPITGPDRFGRMFDLPTFAEPSPALREALAELGRPGGIMDADDPLEVGPLRLITEPELSPRNRDNPTNTAGATFMGQFLDHDITLDAGSRLGRPTPARRSTNLRSARFDLDNVYGGGPTESPELYNGFRLRVESGGQFEDVPRDDEGVAIIADARNDENLIISGLQAAFLMFHNAVLDDIAGRNPNAADFTRAQQIVRWHYQWIVVHEVLPQFIGAAMLDDIVGNGRQTFTPNRARIPLEFQTAAYRFGHSQVRPSYRANLAGDDGEPFIGFVFDPDQFGVQDSDDLTGRQRAPRRFVGWQTFFDFGDGEVRHNKRTDTLMSTPLFRLPMHTIPTDRGEDVGPTSLATRNLLRHITWEIPSGQRVADELGVERLAPGDLTDVGQLGANLDRSTPLFYYLLRESELVSDGLHLGPCGGRIVGEVFMALLDMDPTSYLNAGSTGGRAWRPTLPQRSGAVTGEFTMADLLTVAGVDPTSRGQ